MLRVLSVLLIVLTGACAHTETEQKIEPTAAEQEAAKEIALAKQDPTFAMFKRLMHLNESPMYDMSALEQTEGTYGSNVIVYPLTKEPAAHETKLYPKDAQYPRHILQSTSNVYSAEHSPSVIVYPYEGKGAQNTSSWPQPMANADEVSNALQPAKPRAGRPLTGY